MYNYFFNRYKGSMDKPLILLTGSTGYVGGRLKKALLELGYPLKLLVRSSALVSSKNSERETYVVGDAKDKKTLIQAMQGVSIAYYFIHSMGSKGDFVDEDRLIAAQFAEAAAECGVSKIIYLGGLGSHYENLSPHLQSRHEVGEVLRANADGVQVMEFRASIVIGSGSLSFEMVRALTEKLPVMITPRWVYTLSQPIAIDDLLQYLIQAIDVKIDGNPILEIGGKDKVSYGGLMEEYARQRGLKRYMIHVPVLTPRLSSLWLGLVTPLYARVGKKLVESAICETTVHDPLALHLFSVKPMGYKEAIQRAIANEGATFPETRWNDPLSSAYQTPSSIKENLGGRLIDHREIQVPYTPQEAFRPIERIGGNQGYYYGNFLWHLRGTLDLLCGGVGFRRGRRDQQNLKEGDVVDFWRVEEIKPPFLLRLKAEMKLPGRAWLEFYVEPTDKGSKISQRAVFDPAGIFGIAYWYLLYPLHHLVFNGMLKGIVKRIKP
jgi:uncharacterized protein YbjT (DUF2867 family)